MDFSERERHAEIYRLHRDLLRLRHDDPVLGKATCHLVDGAVLTPQAFVFGSSLKFTQIACS